jgi:hypothetical protein
MKQADELFLIVPLSPRQKLHGYLSVAIIRYSLVQGLMLPLLTGLSVIMGVEKFFILITVVFFFAMLWALLFAFSFIARINTLAGYVFFWAANTLSFGVIFFPILVPFAAFMGFWSIASVLYGLDPKHGYGFISWYVFLPIGLMLYVLVAYILAIRAFEKHNERFFRTLMYNIMVYTSLGIVEVALYSIITITVFLIF